MKSKICAFLVFASVMSFSRTGWTQSITGGVTMPQIIQSLQHQMEQLQSVQGTSTFTSRQTDDYVRVYNPLGNPELKSPTTATHIYKWAYKGNKQYQQSTELYNPQDQTQLHKLLSRTTTELFDGKQHYSVISSQYSGQDKPAIQANVDHRDTGTVTPLSFGYKDFIENKWFVDVLKEGDYQIEGTENDPRYGILYRLSKTTKPGMLARITDRGQGTQHSRLWLAPQYGFVAVRTEFENDMSQMHTITVHQLDKVEKRGSIYFPVSGTMSYYSVENGKRVLLLENQLRVTKFEVNNVPDSAFNPNLQPGAYVKDGETNQYWEIGPNGQRNYIDIGANKETSNIFLNWLFVLSIIVLLMLGMGALLRWRRLHKTA